MASDARWVRVRSYRVARSAVVLGTAGLFFGLAGGIGYLLASVLVSGPMLEPLHAQLLAAVTLLTVAFFGGQTAAMGMLDAYSQGRFPLPVEGLPPPSAARAQNPWRTALQGLFGLGIISAAFTYIAIPRLWPRGLPPGTFALWLGAVAGALCAVQAYAQTGQEFLREATLPVSARAFQGTHTHYLWFRQALPQGLANLFINAWAAAALVPGSFFAQGAAVPQELVLSDACGNLLILLLVTVSSTSVHVSFDVRWGVIPVQQALRPAGWKRWLVLGAGMGALIGVLYVWFVVSHNVAMGAWTFVFVRGLCCGVLCGGAAFAVGLWGLRTS